MGFLKPDVGGTDGNLIDTYPEGEPFMVHAAEVVKARTEYGEGEMVVVTVDTGEGQKRLSIWGSYLVEQVRGIENGELPMRVKITRGAVEGYSDRADTKQFVPA